MNDFYRLKSEHYTTIANEFLKDKELSNKAKGVLAMILALPDNWDFSIKGMVSIIKDGEASLRSAINEMKDKRYCVVKPVRINGKIARWKYYFSGEIITDAMEESLLCDFQQVENQQVENQAQYNNIDNDNNKKNKKGENNKSFSPKNKRFVKPTIKDIEKYIKEKDMHFEAERFFDYYESKGWMVGKSPMKDWKAACRTWESQRKHEFKEEQTEESGIVYPDGMDEYQWTKIMLWLCGCCSKIAGKISPMEFVDYKKRCGDDSKLLSEILIEINSYVELHGRIDISEKFDEFLKKHLDNEQETGD